MHACIVRENLKAYSGCIMASKKKVAKGPKVHKLQTRTTPYKHALPIEDSPIEDASLADLELAEQAMTLKVMGNNYLDICKVMGLKKTRVFELLAIARKAVVERIKDVAEEELCSSLERMNLVIKKHLPIATAEQYKLVRYEQTGEMVMDENAVKEQQKSAEIVLKTEAMRATILGYAKPKEMKDSGGLDINEITRLLASKAAEMIHNVAIEQPDRVEPKPIDLSKVKLIEA
jgi:hypothetical protein